MTLILFWFYRYEPEEQFSLTWRGKRNKQLIGVLPMYILLIL
ncbi:hypothetical protein VB774_16015 [Pseudanabaena galeata UHCC 0370]|uniref:Uncharacterized protein n=1 Tax=Pseudanabaena galeata UHCC 0370 TaxID=3110310 RepID=A0ABU5TNI0_9CYAN|nr:hypothetical protein [Pseudanabaena galeata]MEA5479128.1 hypothetical protein [Pseudanabaena galeata UHCC 0370]WGS72877.1 hypothetical protein OA858_02290 [Pseudanabaena galeata CCNP1313]